MFNLKLLMIQINSIGLNCTKMKSMNTEVLQLADQLRNAFNEKPWYGRSVMSILSLVSPDNAGTPKIDGAFSMCQILHHIITWRTFVAEKISGNSGYRIEVNSEDDWPNADNSRTWDDLLDSLNESQEKLLKAIEVLGDDTLDELAGGTSFTYRQLIQGAIHHDIYHLGQIALLSKLP